MKSRWGAYGQLVISACMLFLLFFNLPLMLGAFFKARLINPGATPLYEDCKGNYLTDFLNADGTYGYWDIEGDIPEKIEKSVLITEDRRYYQHLGFDPHALFRAIVNNMTGRTVQGASTIPMQVARLQSRGSRVFINKIKESYTGIFLILKYGHKKVLRHYLKIIPQGNQMHGVAYAARRYFKKPLKDLNWMECAVLTAILKAPGRMNLFTMDGFFNVHDRARMVLSLLRKEKIISEEIYRVSLKQLLEQGYQWKETRPSNAYHYILRLKEETEKRDNWTSPLRTHLDPDLQEYLQKTADYAMTRYRPFGAGNVALIVAEAESGNILGYIGSDNYFDEAHKGSINFADTYRSSGSTLKPFIFALGLQERHFTPASIIPDLPLSIISPTGEYSAGNFDDDFLGPMIYRRALANSRNIPAIRVLDKTGINESYHFLRSLGLGRGDHKADYYGYGLAIGGLYVTLEQLIRAYGILANEGKSFNLQWSGNTPAGGEEKIMDKNTARQISLYLSDELARQPSFPRLKYMDFNFPVAIKTGTSQGFRDAWTLAYSRRYIVGAWMGEADNAPMNHVAGSIAADLVHRVLLYLQPGESRGINEEPFPLPEKSRGIKICYYSGKLATPDCTRVMLEYFEEGYEPHSPCDYHQEFLIDKLTGLLADNTSHPSNIIKKSFTVFPPEYAGWAVKNGFPSPRAREEKSEEVYIKITYPPTGLRLIINPEIPRKFQTLPLRAETAPSIPAVTWIVDGQPLETRDFPYEARWSLEEGLHTFQAKFARANVYSQKVDILVSGY